MNEDTNYLTTGLNKFFQKGSSSNELMEDQASFDVQQISGSNLSSGISKSIDGKLKIDWNNTLISAEDGARNRVEIGKLPGTDNEYGLRVTDVNGNELFSVGGLADGSVTADKLNVNQLDAVATNTGTLTVDESIAVGGNINGAINVKDSSGNNKVVLDNAGITVNSGKITINDSNDTTILDASGLVGEENFTQFSDTISSQFVTTSTSEVDITGLDSYSIVFSRPIPTLVFVTATLKVEGQGGGDFEGFGKIRLKIDGAVPNDSITLQRHGSRNSGEQTGNLYVTETTHYYSVPSAGTHTYALKALIDTVVAGTPEITIAALRFTIILLGK